MDIEGRVVYKDTTIHIRRLSLSFQFPLGIGRLTFQGIRLSNGDLYGHKVQTLNFGNDIQYFFKEKVNQVQNCKKEK